MGQELSVAKLDNGIFFIPKNVGQAFQRETCGNEIKAFLGLHAVDTSEIPRSKWS